MIFNKRKNAWGIGGEIIQTGRDGLEPLVWASQKISDFENIIKYYNSNIFKANTCYDISVRWLDNRRKNVYVKALGRKGYVLRSLMVSGS